MRIDTQNWFAFDEPTRIIYGCGSVRELADELRALNAKSVTIVCDQGLVRAGIVTRVEKALAGGPSVSVFDGIIPNPLDTTVDEGYRFAKAHNADCIVGVGGGSSLDSAKAIAMLMTNGGTMREYLMEGKGITKPILPTICVPTTAGTGSEVTRTVVATDSRTKFKEGFKDVKLLVAVSTIIDPELMESLPLKVLAACGMDALTHAVESFTSWKGNPITDSLNAGAIRMVGENIRKAYADPKDMSAKGKMLLASTMTGIAFDQSGLGLAHVLGHPMGGLFDVPHGVACAMALPVVMEYNMIAVPEKFVEVARLLGVRGSQDTVYQQGMGAVAAVRTLIRDLGLPETLRAVGITEKDIPAMAKDAMGFPGMIGANPRLASKEDIEALYGKLLG